jgi:Holliday junction resolvase RusA-like endonuclease
MSNQLASALDLETTALFDTDTPPAAPPSALVVFVPGRPAPQGSKHARPIYRGRGDAKQFTGKVAQVDMGGDALKTWRDDLRGQLLEQHGQPATRFGDAAVAVHLEFRIARPKSHYRTGRNTHLLRDGAPPRPTGKPDIDKLSRAVLDAITSAGVWHDDAQVVQLQAAKVYIGRDHTPGCHITISPTDGDQ